jgi:hypothetical protein
LTPESENAATVYLASLGLWPTMAALTKGRLFFHPHLRYWAAKQGSYPALIGLATSFDGDLRAIQCTFLDEGGGGLANVRAPRLYFGQAASMILPLAYGDSGKALCDLSPGTKETVVITQSIETGLRVAQKMPWARICVALSKANLRSFPVELPQISALEIVWNGSTPDERETIVRELATHGKPIDEYSAEDFALDGPEADL